MTKEQPTEALLSAASKVIRLKHYSPRTEQVYLHWIRRYVRFHEGMHPRHVGSREVESFLSHLAVRDHVAASTQDQAFSALLFLYRHVLGSPLTLPIEAVRATRPKRLPTVLTKEETRRLSSI
jgi:site-specific recombinase XerD